MNTFSLGDSIETKFIAKVILIASILFAIFFLVLGEVSLFYQTFTPIAGLLIVIALDHYQYRKTSNIVLIYSISASLLHFTRLTSKHSSIHLLFIVIAILPLIIFKKEEKWAKWSSVTATLLFYFLLEYTLMFKNAVVPLTTESLNLISIFSTITIIFINLIIIHAFSNARKQYEERLLKLNKKLEVFNKELLDVNKKLKESREAQALLTQHSDYAKLVQSIAHEFKNPLQMLQGTAEIGLLKDQQNTELFETIIKSVERLNNVIQPLLLYLNKKTSYVFESVNIIKVVDEIIILSKANCKSKNIELTFEHDIDEIFIFADGQFIGQVIINLLTNAIQAISGAGGAIRILIEYDSFLVNKNMVQAIKLSIKDTGCGIPEEKINSIFMPYESNHSNEHNLGLGLSIVAKIIKDHHGQIKVHSDVGVGTTVAIWLPLSKSGESNAKDVDQMFELDDSFFEK